MMESNLTRLFSSSAISCLIEAHAVKMHPMEGGDPLAPAWQQGDLPWRPSRCCCGPPSPLPVGRAFFSSFFVTARTFFFFQAFLAAATPCKQYAGSGTSEDGRCTSQMQTHCQLLRHQLQLPLMHQQQLTIVVRYLDHPEARQMQSD